jgi:DNA-binding IclR family transcriptional regulator
MSINEDMMAKALEIVESAPIPICIGDIARHLGISWATARQAAMLLALEGSIEMTKTTKSWILEPKRSANTKHDSMKQGKGGD